MIQRRCGGATDCCLSLVAIMAREAVWRRRRRAFLWAGEHRSRVTPHPSGQRPPMSPKARLVRSGSDRTDRKCQPRRVGQNEMNPVYSIFSLIILLTDFYLALERTPVQESGICGLSGTPPWAEWVSGSQLVSEETIKETIKSKLDHAATRLHTDATCFQMSPPSPVLVPPTRCVPFRWSRFFTANR